MQDCYVFKNVYKCQDGASKTGWTFFVLKKSQHDI